MLLIMEGRILNEPMAVTKIDDGTDVNFCALIHIFTLKLQQKIKILLVLNFQL